MPSNYLGRVALDTDTQIPSTGIVAGVTPNLITQIMNAYGAIQTLEAALGIVGTGGTSTPTNPGDRLVCTDSGASMWVPPAPANVQSGTSYTLVIGDASKALETTNASAVTVTIPPNSSVAFSIGTAIPLTQVGTGALTLAAGGGVTLRTPTGTLTARTQYSTLTVRKRGTDEWVVSGDLTGASIEELYVRKTADESVTNSTALQDDNHLSLSVNASTTYEVTAALIYDGDTAGDIKVGWTAPASATLDWTLDAMSPATTGTAGQVNLSHATVSETLSGGARGTGAANRAVALPHGLLQVAGTSGTLQLRWAQNTSSATATTVWTHSYLRAKRVA